MQRHEGELVCRLTLHEDPPGHQVWSTDHGDEHWIDDKAGQKQKKFVTEDTGNC